MKKFAAIALALILAMSTMFATVATAADVNSVESDFSFKGFEINAEKGVVVDVENMIVYGLSAQLKKENLGDYLVPGSDFELEIRNMELDGYIGTGTQLVLIDKKDSSKEYPFTVVIFGDVTGDSVYDVLDAVQMEKYVKELATPSNVEVMAADKDNDGAISVEDFSKQVNVVVGELEVAQNNNGTVEESEVEVDDQVFTGEAKPVVTTEDITLTFNNGLIDEEHYVIDEDSYYYYTNEAEELIGQVTVNGTGLFGGSAVVEFKVVSLLEKIVATVNGVIEDAKLNEVVNLVKKGNNVDVVIDAGAVIAGDFAADVSALNGLLAKIDDFRAKNLKEVSLVVEEYALANNGAFNRGEIKALGFDLVSGIFTAIANAENNTIKSYSGTLVTNDKVPAEDFTVNFVMDGTGREIDKVKAFAAKIANFVSFDVVDGNAVVDIAMPAGFATTIVDVIGDGDVEKAVAEFNTLSVSDALIAVSAVDAEMLSPAYANAINQIIEIACSLDAVADKALKEVTNATVTDYVGNTRPLLSGEAFYVEDASIVGLVEAVDRVLNDEAGSMKLANFANGDIYTAEFDVAIEYKGISEKVIVNFDFFGNAKAPNVIDKTAAHFNGIIADLGIANVANVAYSADTKNAVATLNASAFINNDFAFNEAALDGLYTDIKGYFDDNYGTSTILVGDYEIVTAGKINKTALKNFLFDVAKGFFLDVADMDADKVIRNFSVEVKEADGSSVDFDMDFVLEGTPAHIAKIKNIAAKVAECISFTTVNGNAVVNITLPASLRNTIVKSISLDGTVESAIAEFDVLTVELAMIAFASIDVEKVAPAYASDINRIVLTVAEYSNVINKLLGKVENVSVKDLNGYAYNVLNGNDFVVDLENNDNAFNAAVMAIYDMMDAEGEDAVLDANVANFTTGNGVYTVEFDVATSIGGINEKVIVNFDMFGIA